MEIVNKRNYQRFVRSANRTERKRRRLENIDSKVAFVMVMFVLASGLILMIGLKMALEAGAK